MLNKTVSIESPIRRLVTQESAKAAPTACKAPITGEGESDVLTAIESSNLSSQARGKQGCYEIEAGDCAAAEPSCGEIGEREGELLGKQLCASERSTERSAVAETSGQRAHVEADETDSRATSALLVGNGVGRECIMNASTQEQDNGVAGAGNHSAATQLGQRATCGQARPPFNGRSFLLQGSTG